MNNQYGSGISLNWVICMLLQVMTFVECLFDSGDNNIYSFIARIVDLIASRQCPRQAIVLKD